MQELGVLLGAGSGSSELFAVFRKNPTHGNANFGSESTGKAALLEIRTQFVGVAETPLRLKEFAGVIVTENFHGAVGADNLLVRTMALDKVIGIVTDVFAVQLGILFERFNKTVQVFFDMTSYLRQPSDQMLSSNARSPCFCCSRFFHRILKDVSRLQKSCA